MFYLLEPSTLARGLCSSSGPGGVAVGNHPHDFEASFQASHTHFEPTNNHAL